MRESYPSRSSIQRRHSCSDCKKDASDRLFVYETELYTVALGNPENGTLKFEDEEEDTAEFAEGDEVEISVTPDEGYEFLKITFTPEEAEEPAAEDDDLDEGKYSFVMPAVNLTVEAEFDRIGATAAASLDFPENGSV